MNRRKRRRICKGVCAAALGMLCMVQGAVPAFAKEAGKNANGSLTVNYATESGGVSGTPMSLYYVGTKGDNGLVAWDEDFAGYRLYGKEIGNMSTVLQGYVQRDGVEPDMEADADEEGSVTFEGLADGYYLVMGEPMEQDGVTLHMMPVLAFVDGDDAEAPAEAKFERLDVGQGPIDITVKKNWELKEDKVEKEAVLSGSGQPKSVQADLMQDGKLYDTVKLSEKNGWSHTWEGLPSGHVYQALETAVGEGFEMSVNHRDGKFTITNHGVYTSAVSTNPPTIKEPEEDKPEVTPSDATEKPDDTQADNTANESQQPTQAPQAEAQADKLPQTGMVFWPIVICAGLAGAAGIGGYIFIRKGKRG